MLVVGPGEGGSRNKDLADRLVFCKMLPARYHPFQFVSVLRGLKTLHLRMRAHCENAQSIAEMLAGHSAVEAVIYSGLDSHPQHELACKQMNGFGGMITAKIRGGLDESRRFSGTMPVFALAESLGGVESLIEHPAIMTHASVPRGAAGTVGYRE